MYHREWGNAMANRRRELEEKVESVEVALKQINVEKAAREAGVPASTLRYDLNKVKKGLAEVLSNKKPGSKTVEKGHGSGGVKLG